MAFSLPSDLSTSWVDDSSTITAGDWNNIAGMGNAIKAAIATLGFSSAKSTVAATETTSSTSYTDLTTTTDQVTVPIGSSGKALVIISCGVNNASPNGYEGRISYAMSGANNVSAADTKFISYAGQYSTNTGMTNATFLETDLTPGFTTFKLKYRATSSTVGFHHRTITVIPFPATDGTHAAGTFNLDATSAISLAMAGAGLNRPTYDATGSGYGTATSVTTGSVTHTGASGATPILAAGIGCSTNNCVLSATYGGVAMTELGRVWDANTASTGMVFFALLGGCDGTQKTVTLTSSTNLDQGLTMQCISYANVGSFGKPAYACGTASGMSISSALIPAGGLALNGFHHQTNTNIAGYNQTSRYVDARATYDAFLFGEAPVPSTTGTTITFSATSSTYWGSVILPVYAQTQNIAWDTKSSTASGAGSISSTTLSHTGANGATPIVAVGIESGSSPISSSTIAATYNGASMTLIGYIPAYDTYDIAIALFGKIGACTGSACNVVVSNTPNAQGIFVGCSSYTNVVSFGAPVSQTCSASTPSLTVPSSPGQRIVFASHNHYSTAKGFSQITGITRFNDNTYRVSSANPGTTFLADAPADSGSSTAVSAYSAVSYGQGTIGTALTTNSPVTVAFDAVGGGVYWAGTTGGNWNHTIAGNALVIFGTMWYSGGFTLGWNINGQAITPTLTSQLYFNNGYYFGSSWCWTLLNPPTGTVNIACSVTSGNGPIQITMNSVSYTNVGSIGTPITNTGSSTTATTNAAGLISTGRIAHAFGSDGTNTFTSYSQTQRYNQGYHASDARPLVIGDAAGNPSGVTFTAASSPAVDYTAVTVPLFPAYFV